MGLCFGSRTGSAQGSQEERASPGGSAAEEEAQSQLTVGVMVRRQGHCSPPRVLRYVARFALRLGVCATLATSEMNEAVVLPPPPKTCMSRFRVLVGL